MPKSWEVFGLLPEGFAEMLSKPRVKKAGPHPKFSTEVLGPGCWQDH